MNRLAIILLTSALLVSCGRQTTGFLHTEGKRIVNGKGEEVLLRGIGLGGWMLQEPYMLKLADVSPAQYDIKRKIAALVGEERCHAFYDAWLNNMITRRDIDSLKA